MAHPASPQANFVPGFDDLPLMPELVAGSESPVVFDAPGGRIIDVQMAGRTSAARVIDFYRDTLPQLGWHVVGSTAGTFEREGEILKLLIDEPERGRVAVRFSLAPSGSGGK
jgi:hypothetical protein